MMADAAWCYEREALGQPCEALQQAQAEVAALRAVIWGACQLMPDRPAQAEGLLRSALPEGYRPVGA